MGSGEGAGTVRVVSGLGARNTVSGEIKSCNREPHMEGSIEINLILYADCPDTWGRRAKTHKNHFAAGQGFYNGIIHVNYSSLQDKADNSLLPQPRGNQRDDLSKRGDKGDGIKLWRTGPQLQSKSLILFIHQNLYRYRIPLALYIPIVVMCLSGFVPPAMTQYTPCSRE